MTEGLRVVELRATNFMGLRAVEVSPSGDVVIIGGNNGQGKTSLLNAIECAIRGKKYHPQRPVREGAETGEVVLDLGELKIRRTFNPDRIAVENADGFKAKTPQKMLDDLAGAIAFDPLEFVRLDGKAQLRFMRELSGVDFERFDQERQIVYEQRTGINAEVGVLKRQLEEMPRDEDVDGSFRDSSELAATHENIINANAENDQRRLAIDQMITQRSQKSAACDASAATVQAAEKALTSLKEGAAAQLHEYREFCDRLDEEKRVVSTLVNQDPTEIVAQIQGVSEWNEKVRANAARETKSSEYFESKRRADKLTDDISTIDEQKREAISAAEIPVDGLSFDDGVVTLAGIPFAQCSSAEQLRTSVAMGIALNPRLHVMLVRDGSLLDDASMTMIAEIAAQHDQQIWIERVGDSDAGAIVIEDGLVANPESADPASHVDEEG